MLIAFIFYCLTIFLFIIAKQIKNKIIKPILNCRVLKNGVCFFSNKRHKLKVENAKLLMVKDVAFLKNEHKTIAIKNVKDVCLKNDYIYFTGLGNVKIIFNCEKFYRYFNIKIISADFDLKKNKDEAVLDILNHIFCLKNAKKLQKYLKILIFVLKISINEKKVLVRKNKYNLSFKLIYRLNNVLKVISIKG